MSWLPHSRIPTVPMVQAAAMVGMDWVGRNASVARLTNELKEAMENLEIEIEHETELEDERNELEANVARMYDAIYMP